MNRQLTLWQPCGTSRTISKGVEASYLIDRNQRLCDRNVFGIQEVLDFLFQPATVLNLCILCVYLCKVRVVLQRTTTVYMLKWGEIRSLSENKFPSLCLYVYLRSMPTRLRQAELHECLTSHPACVWMLRSSRAQTANIKWISNKSENFRVLILDWAQSAMMASVQEYAVDCSDACLLGLKTLGVD
jgi:hypothetical protein